MPSPTSRSSHARISLTPDALDVSGLDLGPDRVAQALRVDADEWRAELPQITEWFETFGEKLPTVMWDELETLRSRLGGH